MFIREIYKLVDKTNVIDMVIDELKFRHDKLNKLNYILQNNYNIAAKQARFITIIWCILLILNIILVIVVKRMNGH